MEISWKEFRRRAPKVRDCWARKLLADPIALPLTYFLVRHTKVTPVQLTIGSFLTGALAGLAFASGHLITGAGFYYLHFLLDAMDGKSSRVRQEDDTYRGSLDFMGDGIVEVLVAVGLALSGDKTLAILLLGWMCIYYLGLRFYSLTYKTMMDRGIQNKLLVDPKMEAIYLKSVGGLVGWIIKTYHRVSYKMAWLGVKPIPSTGESAVLIYVIGTTTWLLTVDISWMYLFTSIGIIFALPVTVGAGIIAYALTKGGGVNEVTTEEH